MSNDAVLDDLADRIEKIAYALRQDGRTADGCTKDGAAKSLDTIVHELRLYLKFRPALNDSPAYGAERCARPEGDRDENQQNHAEG